jgi:hypothetical protein
MRKKLPLVLCVVLSSCSGVKPVARTVNDIAREACELFFAEQQGMSMDVARDVCAARDVLDPFVREILSAQKAAGAEALPAAKQKQAK